MKTILICGSSGNVGSFLFENLKHKYKVLGTSNSPSSKYFKIDLLDKKKITRSLCDLGSIDTLIFTVGLAHSKGKNKEYKKFEEVNLITLKNILLSLKELNNSPEKIIFTSTISVYGEKIDSTFYIENDKLNPSSPYAITKQKAEFFLLEHYPEKCWILRLSPVYSTDFELNLVRRVKIGRFFFKIGDGNKKLSLCNIKNIKKATEEIIDDNIPNGIYNVSDNTNYSYNDILSYYSPYFITKIPYFLLKLLYIFAKIFSNRFLIENSIKLLSDNIYPSDKIGKFVKLNKKLKR